MIAILRAIFTAISTVFPIISTALKVLVPSFTVQGLTKFIKWTLMAAMFSAFAAAAITFFVLSFQFLISAYNHASSFVSHLNSSFGGGCLGVLMTDLGISQALQMNLPVFFAVVTAIVLKHAAKTFFRAFTAFLDFVKGI